ncbi:hypothetical protein JCM9533A_84290 [Catenuloplanes niger JCM 9533]
MGVAAPAHAAERDGTLESGEFGLFHRTNTALVLDLRQSDTDLRDDVFPGTAIAVHGNTGWFANRDTVTWHLYTGPNFTGSQGCVEPGHIGGPGGPIRFTIASSRRSSAGC